MAKKRTKFNKYDLADFNQQYREDSGEGRKRQDNRTAAKDITIKGSALHQVIVKVNERLVSEIKTNIGVMYKDPTFDIYHNMKICGEVVAVPKRLRGSVLYENDPGFPQPQGRLDKVGNKTHTSFKRTFTTLEGTKVRVRMGDKIYFHYLTLTDQNYLGKDIEGMELYKCGYEQIFCILHPKGGIPRKGIEWGPMIEMINGWVAVTPYFDESYEEVKIPDIDIFGRDTGRTRTIKVKQSESGIIYDINEKPMYRHGKIWSLSIPSPDGIDYKLQAGDKVVYTHYSEFKNTIDGKEYYIMKLWDIIGLYKESQLVPVNDRVLVDIKKVAESNIIIPDKYKMKPNEGFVLGVGENVKEVARGDHVYFDYNSTYFLELPNFTGAFIKENQIAFKYEKEKRN